MNAFKHPVFKPIQSEMAHRLLVGQSDIIARAFEAGYKAGLDDLWQRLTEAKGKMGDG